MSFKLPSALPPLILENSHKIEVMSVDLISSMTKRRQAALNKVAKKRLIDSFLSLEVDKKDQPAEIKNIKRVCRHLATWDPLSVRDFKQAHFLLMEDLAENRGQWRKEEVVVLAGKKIAHTPPKPKEVAKLMQMLFRYMKEKRQFSWLIKACLFHYGIQYIHPFSDGNGRMGRIWQHLFLLQQSPIFHYVLIGDLIKKHYLAYYKTLDKSDIEKDCTIFIAFCLRKIAAELRKIA